jgi:transposase
MQGQIVALTGLEPIEKESGSSVRSRPKISKAGSRLYRGSLFMSAMVSIRHNEQMKQFFERLKANGKHTTAAQMAVMRKLVIIAHSLYKNH